ncbi:hypothetical protein EDD21DRAFT_386382 [Dissophora ornata]|nr:hypothetical protein EDD21DRAFT_386382 [Dissophora ornata]
MFTQQYPPTWQPAYKANRILYRVLREHDDLRNGISATDPEASLTLYQHLNKGMTNSVKSQFISTTMNEDIARLWTRKGRCCYVAINCGRLDKDILLLDISMGDPEIGVDGNIYAKKHSEVLIYPRINAEAITVVYGFIDKWPYFYEILCQYCHKKGHDHERRHYCLEFEVHYAIKKFKDTVCQHCRAQGHDIGRGDYCPKYDVDRKHSMPVLPSTRP